MKKYYHLNNTEKLFEEGCQPEGWELGYSEKRRQEISDKALGRTVWNSGKHTGENSNKKLYHLDDEERFFEPESVPDGWIIGPSNRRKQNISTSTKGRNAWNKGETKQSNLSVLKYTQNNLNRNKFKSGDENEAKTLKSDKN